MVYGGYARQTDRNMMSLVCASAEYKVSLSELTSAHQAIEKSAAVIFFMYHR